MEEGTNGVDSRSLLIFCAWVVLLLAGCGPLLSVGMLVVSEDRNLLSSGVVLELLEG